MSESFAELFEESLAFTQMKPGTIINGTVIDIRSDIVVVSAGLKSEGVIPIEQFYSIGGELEVGVGDVVEVTLDSVEDGMGETRLSREKAKRAKAWKVLEQAQEADEIVKGVITGKVKGGFTVELDSIRAFLPGSLVDVRPVRDTAYLEGKELEFKLIKLDQRVTMLWCLDGLWSNQSSAQNAKSYSRTCKKVRVLRASSRILPITVPFWIWAVLMACYILQTWLGNALSIHQKSLKLVKKLTSKYLSLTESAIEYH